MLAGYKIAHRYRSVRMAIYLTRRRWEICVILPRPTRAGYAAYGVPASQWWTL